MASEIDEAIPADNVRVEKGLLRDNFRAAKEEIEELQRLTEFGWLLALGAITL